MFQNLCFVSVSDWFVIFHCQKYETCLFTQWDAECFLSPSQPHWLEAEAKTHMSQMFLDTQNLNCPDTISYFLLTFFSSSYGTLQRYI